MCVLSVAPILLIKRDRAASMPSLNRLQFSHLVSLLFCDADLQLPTL